MKKISFLGVGNMGGAVLNGLRSKSYKLGYYSPNSTVKDVEKFQSLADAVAWGDIIILGMKPQIFQTLDFPENKQKNMDFSFSWNYHKLFKRKTWLVI
jgi:pyrroline-5-carboxylate reductase